MQSNRSTRQRHSSNPYKNDSTTAHGNKSEVKTLKRLSARGTPASGAMEHSKSDGILDLTEVRKFRIENKSTINESMSVKRSWLIKICKEALETSRDPLLTLQFVNGDGTTKKDGKWVMMRENDFLELIGAGSEFLKENS